MSRVSSSSRLLLCLALLAGCSGSASDSDADGGNTADAAPLRCSEKKALAIGQCIDAETSAPCLNFESTQRTWLTIDEQPVIPSIIGLQGSPMFVMSVSGNGIEPGSDSTSPYVELEVTRGEELVGAYAARPTVIEDPNAPANMLAPQLYVVAFLAEDMVGQTVQVRAEIKDLNDDQWCTEGSFEVGPLFQAPPLP